MLHHKRLTPPGHDYPPDEWNVIEKNFHPEFIAQMEAVLALGNGYFGMRGGAITAVRLKDGVERWNTYIEPLGINGVPSRCKRRGERDSRCGFRTSAGRHAPSLLHLQWRAALAIRYDAGCENRERRPGQGWLDQLRRRGYRKWDGLCHFGLHRIPAWPAGEPTARLRTAESVSAGLQFNMRSTYE